MAIQQGAGYRDPAKTMTIKALQERQKAAQLATAKAVEMPQQISDPWQAASHVLGVGASRFADLSAGRQEADARAHLAQVMSGIDPEKGASMQQIAEMQQLDPEFANKEYERMMAERANIRDREDTQQFQTGERVGGQQFTAGESEKTRAATAAENDLNRQADVARQKMSDAAAAGRQDDQQAATVELERIQAQIAETKAKTDQEIKTGAIGQEADARLAEGQKLGLKDEDLQRYAATGNMPLQQDKFNTPQGMEQLNKWNQQVGQYDSALRSFERAKQLTDEIPDALLGDFQVEASKILTSAGPMGLSYVMPLIQKLPGMENVTAEQVQKLMEYDRIVGLNAMTAMSQTLKGQTTDREMGAFLQRLAAGGMLKAERHTMIDNLMNAIKTDRDFTGMQLKSQGVNVDPYVSRVQPAPATEPAATPAPDLSNASQEEIDAAIRKGPGK